MEMDKSIELLHKLKRTANESIKKERYEKALAALSAATQISYYYNQFYVDEEIESMLKLIGNKLYPNAAEDYCAENKVALFYDGMGFDTRGLALIFLNALAGNGYKIIYVTDIRAKDKQPKIHKDMSAANIEYHYISMTKSYLHWSNKLLSIFRSKKPEVAFLYTSPYDVVAAMVYRVLDGVVTRYQIDLTDHAYWIGKYSFDYCVELRDVGSKISYNYRGIPKGKMVMLPYYAYYDKDQEFLGIPFDLERNRLIFSGGSLFKTFGDPENKYYKIVDYILSNYEDTVFMYAGEGDKSELEKLKAKFSDRVYYTNERKDFYQIMERCEFYLNTYPMFGGMMMNYAVTAGKIPLTLKHNNDSDGLLFNQDKLGIEFNTLEEVYQEIDNMLGNRDYLIQKERRLKNCVITRKQFEEQLEQLLVKHTTRFNIDTGMIDTSVFQTEFLRRFNYKKSAANAIIKKINWPIALNYPCLIINKIYLKAIRQRSNRQI